MGVLDPIISAIPARLPTGPREEYKGERPPFRRDEPLPGDRSTLKTTANSEQSVFSNTQADTANTKNDPIIQTQEQENFPDTNNQKLSECKNQKFLVKGSQRDQVLSAVESGSHTITEIANTTGLSKDQTRKAVSALVKMGLLYDIPMNPDNKERTVSTATAIPACSGDNTNHLPDRHEVNVKKLGNPESQPNHHDQTNKDIISELESEAMKSIKILHNTISRLACLARENADARDRLAAVQKLLGS